MVSQLAWGCTFVAPVFPPLQEEVLNPERQTLDVVLL